VKAFAQLYVELDATTSTGGKLDALARYYASASPADAAWATYFLAGGKPRQSVPSAVLRDAAVEASGLAPWLFEECYQASATSPRPSRTCCRRPSACRTAGSRRGSRGCSRCGAPIPPRSRRS
jgi:hypothetical protein